MVHDGWPDAEKLRDLSERAAFESTDGGVTWERIPGTARFGTGDVTLTLPDGRWLVTGGNWPLDVPDEVLKDHSFSPIALQIGPFLQVANADGCLPILSEPSHDSEEFACMAERVLLTDLVDATEADGTTWHSVRTPAGIEGWADGRHLE